MEATFDNTPTLNLSRVETSARIAVYDDLLSSPQIINISPNTTREYINDIASTVHKSAKDAGGKIPYSVILQVAENFIHSYFSEVVVTILDGGNTIRFSDQGPGISDIEKAKTPGFSSATAEMKQVIHGVGSGLPIVTEYMETMNGRIEIEDNINTGAVITISLTSSTPASASSNLPKKDVEASGAPLTMKELIQATISERGMQILELFRYENTWGVSAISSELGLANSTVHADLKKLEEAGLIVKIGTKRMITDLGITLLNGQL